jgi:HEAT repeat protein
MFTLFKIWLNRRRLKSEDPSVRLRAAEQLSRVRDERALPPLLELLEDSEYFVVITAIEGIGMHRSPNAVEALASVLRSTNPPAVMGEESTHARAVRGLQHIGPPATTDAMCNALQSEF